MILSSAQILSIIGRMPLVALVATKSAKAHHHAVTISAAVHTQISSARTHKAARHCLKKIMGAVRYLVRQGVAFQGHAANEGNLCHVVK